MTRVTRGITYVILFLSLLFFSFTVSCRMNNVYDTPGTNSIWVTTALGDVYVFDPAIAEVKQMRRVHWCVVSSFKTSQGHLFSSLDIFCHIQDCQLSENEYVQEMDVSGKDLPFESILQNGFGYGNTLKITVCIHDDADR